MTTQRVIAAAADGVLRNERTAGPGGSVGAPLRAAARRGIITAVNENGTVDVEVRGASATAETIAGLLYWGQGVPVVGDKVLLVYEDPRPVPYAAATGYGVGGGENNVNVTDYVRFFTV